VKNNASATSGVLTVAPGPDFDPGEFVLSGDTCSTTTVPAGGTCTVDVAFDPNTTGDKVAEVVATRANASDGTAKAIVLHRNTLITREVVEPRASGPGVLALLGRRFGV
jgi:hypothetical protein